MKPTRIMVFSSAGTGLSTLSRAFARFVEAWPGVMEISARTGEDLFDSLQVDRFLASLPQYDRLILLLHGGKASCPFFDRLMDTRGELWTYIHPSDPEELELSQEYSTDFGAETYDEMVLYLKYGGQENWFNLFKRLAGQDAAEPEPQPCQALYHPRLGLKQDLDSYLKALGWDSEALRQSGKPVVGLWFGQYSYLDSNLEPMDAVIEELEAQGAVPVSCFYRRYPDPLLDVRDTAWVVDNYFSDSKGPLIQALISPMMFSLAMIRPGEEKKLQKLGVPILQAMHLLTNRDFWQSTVEAVTPMDVGISIAQPEFDGNLITVPAATKEKGQRDPLTGAGLSRMEPIPERIEKMVKLALNWARLSRKSNQDKKVAIIFHNYPPRNDRIGCAYGLDSFASVRDLLARLKEEGYTLDQVYEDSRELADLMTSSLTCDQRWLTYEAMAEKAADRAGAEHHKPWHEGLPDKAREHLAKDWGQTPGELFVHDQKVLINGVINGNVYIGIQPPRGYIEQPEKIHDPYLAPSYHYLYYYRWIKDVFKADAVMHIGKHGSLEWLPGKSVALGPDCYPDLAIMDLPNIYPYIINDPGEGTQAKRRSYCTIMDHLIPVMTNADTYEELAQVDNAILDYLQASSMNPTRLPVLQKQIWEEVEKANLDKDLETTWEQAREDFDGFMERLHSYLSEVGDTAIADGLHTFGTPPRGGPLAELTTQIVRLNNGDVPSLRQTVCVEWGYDYDYLLANRGRPDPAGNYPTCAKALEAVHNECRRIVLCVVEGEEPFSEDVGPDLKQVYGFLRETLLPRLRATTDEMTNTIAALNGSFVPPGGSGAPTRGQSDILPTGRNFFSVDPMKIPAPAAWKVGVDLARDLVERNKKETGAPPDNVGMVLWGGPVMRTQGEDIAEALFLMGIKPVWNSRNGRVEGLEVIPLKELEFPRVDITFRTSGFFRDSFPNLMELLDKAVLMAGRLREPLESNFLRRNVVAESEELAKQGLSPEDAWREASLRVYSDPPGTYGTGLPETIDSKAWEKSEDLGEVWVNYGGYAYSSKGYGLERRDNLKRRLKKINLVVKNEDSREYDMLSSDDFNAYFGGFVCAVKAFSGIQPRAYSGDASDPDRVKNRSIQEEAKHVFRSRILNPKWIQGLMRHGYKGAGDLSRTVDTSFHWDATSGVIDDWMYEGLAQKYAFDKQMQDWLKEVNPYALQNITERLLEAISRGMWQADPETKQELMNIFLDVEGDIEDATS
ncbi:cobaltochelatase subunit CobN [Dethiosulfatarculus sandiegensis]|uniref:Cobalamin biosynthesis protein CobN n=1 Tax=Dethiosulfatarculus sandiegensis TaxID=1429043 RepID=A0A0D2JRM6_9BACT|nr:cobaltochelatase subunit CobN [Dethiosulfatarculus sandiegensis]KIX12160.1 cobalamin biosynthesis protein CobN [Dethiosulfatarculus sandiegensis]